MALTDLALTEKEAKNEMGCCCAEPGEAPKYPYGLCLYLDKSTMEKLGISADVKVGTPVNIMATAVISGTSQRQNQNGETYQSMDIQLTAMDISGLPKSTAEIANKLYGATPADKD